MGPSKTRTPLPTCAWQQERGSLTNYAGEFRSDMEQALRQLQAAQDLMNKMLRKRRERIDGYGPG